MARGRALLLLALCYAAFVSIGLPDGLLGVAWPSIRAGFGLPLDALAPLLVMWTAGYVLSSFSSGRILSRINVGALLALSCVATAASLLGYAAAPVWAAMVACGGLAGLGAGAIDAGLNTYVATHHSARTLNWLHACYGIGTATGPALMTAVLAAGQPWQRGYALVGLAQLALAACFAATLRLWPAPGAGPRAADTEAAAAAATLRLPVVWTSCAAFFVYVGIEASFGTWAYTLLTQGRGVPMESAAFWVSAFWVGLTVGRLLFGLVAARADVDRLLRVAIAGIAVAALLVSTSQLGPAVNFAGLALAGLACGPVFPSLIAATPARVGSAHAANTVGFEVAAAALGQSLLPSAAGVLADRWSLELIAPALFAAALALLALHATLARRRAPAATAITVAPST